MAEPKTKPTTQTPTDFLNTLEDEQKRADSLALLKIFEEVTGERAAMWGTSIVGFGKYHYQSERSSQEGDWPLVGFSPRKQNLTLYIMAGNQSQPELIKRLGKCKTTVGCIYIKNLATVDVGVLKELIKNSFGHMRKLYPAG